MDKASPRLSYEDCRWLSDRLIAFTFGTIGPFIVYHVHCFLPWWLESAHILFDILGRARLMGSALVDWRLLKPSIWIQWAIWAIWAIYLHAYIDSADRLLVHEWMSYFLVGSWLQHTLFYLHSDGPTRREEANVVISRQASIWYALVMCIMPDVERDVLLATGRWIVLSTALYLTVSTIARWLGYQDYIVKPFWNLSHYLATLLVRGSDNHDSFEARMNRLFHMAALSISRTEQEREERVRRGTRRFQHQPLMKGEIRLLVLWPTGKFVAGTVEAHIEHHLLESAPAYEALSYCWGSADRTDRILIDGKAFPVTASALDLLVGRRRFDRRLSYQSRRVWIDAICIDQSNDVEKTAQVQRMRDIYQRATRVIAYPGGDIDPIRARLSVPALYEQADALAYESGVSPLAIRDINGRKSAPRWKGIAQLLTSEYFHRAWIIQEIAVGQDVQLLLGGLYVPWDTFSKATQWFTQPERWWILLETIRNEGFSAVPRGSFHNIEILTSVRSDSDIFGKEVGLAKRRSLEMLLHYTQTFRCSDPRDKIFALSGIASDYADCDLLRPDYMKSVEKVFEDVARYLLLHRDPPSVSLLSFAGIGFSKSRKELPSWVPDWSEKRFSRSFCEPSGLAREDYSFRAGIGPTLDIRTVSTAPHILVKGLKCDVISALSSAGPLEFKPLKFGSSDVGILGTVVSPERVAHMAERVRLDLAWVKAAINLVESQQSISAEDKADMLQERFWCALVADRIMDARPPPLVYKAAFTLWLRFVTVVADTIDDNHKVDIMHKGQQGQGPLAGLSQEGEAENKVQRYNTSMGGACVGRVFGITERGRMCLVPALTKIGDEVFIPHGARTPFIVRQVQVSKHGGTYELIGEAYVQGIMMGEALKSGGSETTIELQ